MADSRRIYFDNAATSWPKPPAVYEAVDRYLREVGTPAGRGGYRTAEEAERLVAGCRKQLASLLGLPNPRNVVFAFNGTDALNIAIQGCLTAGDHVVTTAVEHNSVLRPLRFLEEQARVEVTRVACNGQGVVSPGDMRDALRPETKLVVMTHASNVTGAIQPIEQVGEWLAGHSAMLLVDAAQTAGHLCCNVTRLGADMIAMSGHKGLLGPLGTGILAIRDGIEEQVRPFRLGGTGTQSEQDQQPDTLPEKFEAGNLNLPGIAGLRAGLEYLLEQDLQTLHQRTMELTGQLLDGLLAINGVTILGPTTTENRTAVVSFTLSGYDPQEVAAMLDSTYRIEARAGLHCAPEIHRRLGTFPSGTVRFSLGAFNTTDEIDTAIQAIFEISSAAMTV